MFNNCKALLVLLISTYSVSISPAALAHARLDAGSMMHISLHASIALGVGAVIVFAGIVLIRRLKKEQVKK